MSCYNIPHNFNEEDISRPGFCSCFSATMTNLECKWDMLCLVVRQSFRSTKECVTEKINNILSGFDKLEEEENGNDNGNIGVSADGTEDTCVVKKTQQNDTVLAEGEIRCEFCKINVADVVILPCGHSMYCNECLEKWYETSEVCPKCKVSMHDVVQCI
ncbi:MAG: hypothetical protein CMB73_05480 [Euryarchaeota archaeon]|nr:hypothetical protein [Euryarchaeota archaeon]|tara:strand:+ start:248 stop:724 length:477 start_codon:yes stop_codon:yes gene_type:complete